MWPPSEFCEASGKLLDVDATVYDRARALDVARDSEMPHTPHS